MKGILYCTCYVLKVTPMCMYWLSFWVWKIATMPHALTSTSITIEKVGMCYHLLFYTTFCSRNWWYIRFPYMDCNLKFEVLTAVSPTVWISGVMGCCWASSADVSKSLCSCYLTLKMKERTCFKTLGTICLTTHCIISENLNLQVMQWLELHHKGKLVLQMASFSDTCVVCCRCDWVCFNVRRQSSFMCICAGMKCCWDICSKGWFR